MSGLAFATMVLICGVVWGGFASLVLLAVSRESVKIATAGAEGDETEGSGAR